MEHSVAAFRHVRRRLAAPVMIATDYDMEATRV